MKLKSFLLILGFCVPLGTSILLSSSKYPLNNQYLYLTDLLFIALAFIYLLHVKQAPSKNAWPQMVVGSVLTLSTFALLLLPRETYTWYMILKILQFISTALILQVFFRVPVLFSAMAYGLVWGGLFQVVLSVAQFYMQHSLGFHILGEPNVARDIAGIAKIDLPNAKYIRAYGTFNHPNPLSAFLIVAYGTSLYLFAKSKRHIIFHTIQSITLAFGIFLTFSRAAIGVFSILSVVFIYLLHMEHENKQTTKRIAVTTFIAIILGISLLFPYLKARTQTAPTPFNRTLYNQTALEIFKDHPWGVGVGNGLAEMRKRLPVTEEWQVQPPHNFFLEVSLETGLVGLILVLWLFIYLFKILIQNIKEGESLLINSYLLAIFIGVIILMFFDHYFYTIEQTQLMLVVVIAMILSQNKTSRLLS